MHATFADAVRQLWRTLSLTPPPADQLQSLTVGDCAVHVTEQPEGHVLMFTCVPADQPVNTAMIHDQNSFGGEIIKPVIAFDETSQHWLVWNRQPLSSCDDDAMTAQLTQLVECAEQFFQTVPAGT